MEPISDFMRQLFPAIPKDKITTLSCRHVIPKDNLLTQVVSVGPRKVDLEFKFTNRGDEATVSPPTPRAGVSSHDKSRWVRIDILS